MRRSYHKARPKEEKNFRVNEQIRVPMVHLIDLEGVVIGDVPIAKALEMAREAESDLVEVNPKGTPPIVKIMDFGQFKYEQDKKSQKQKARNKKTDTKTVRLSVKIGIHDFNVRLAQGKNFLKKGHKLLLDLRLKGREKQHPEVAGEVLMRFYQQLAADTEIEASIEQGLTKMGGKFNMLIINKKS